MKPEPAVLAEVEKKLKEGLPPIEPKAVAEQPKVSPPSSMPLAPLVEPAPRLLNSVPDAAPTEAAKPAAYRVTPGQSLWSIAVDKLGKRQPLHRDPEPQPAAPGRPRPAGRCPARN